MGLFDMPLETPGTEPVVPSPQPGQNDPFVTSDPFSSSNTGHEPTTGSPPNGPGKTNGLPAFEPDSQSQGSFLIFFTLFDWTLA